MEVTLWLSASDCRTGGLPKPSGFVGGGWTTPRRPVDFQTAGWPRIFLSCGKLNTDIDAIARDGGVVASIALQFGSEVETLRGALLRDDRGGAASALGAALDQIVDAGDDGRAA
jgi:hypothetical protein